VFPSAIIPSLRIFWEHLITVSQHYCCAVHSTTQLACNRKTVPETDATIFFLFSLDATCFFISHGAKPHLIMLRYISSVARDSIVKGRGPRVLMSSFFGSTPFWRHIALDRDYTERRQAQRKVRKADIPVVIAGGRVDGTR
jgi:hypothetical protein